MIPCAKARLQSRVSGRVHANVFSRFLMFYPFLVFAIPLGLGNETMQPISALVLLPHFVYCARRCLPALFFFAFVTFNSMLHACCDKAAEVSFYQFLRSGLPLLYSLTLLCGARALTGEFATIVRRCKPLQLKAELAFTIFVGGQIAQLILTWSGFNFANRALFSPENDRVFLFPLSVTELAFFFGARTNRHVLTILSAIVLLATGSKSVFLTQAGLFLIAQFGKIRLSALIGIVVSGAGLFVAADYINPTSLNRTADFLTAANVVDVARGEEIVYAMDAFLRGPETLLFGNGLARSLTPGIVSIDPRWSENSKYDIENGYWSVLAKLGVFGALYICYGFYKLGFDAVVAAILFIEAVGAAASSAFFFAGFDGAFLLTTGALIRAVLAQSELTRAHKFAFTTRRLASLLMNKRRRLGRA